MQLSQSKSENNQNVGYIRRNKTDLCVQRLNNLSYLLQRLNSRTVRILWTRIRQKQIHKEQKAYIGLWFIEHEQTSSTLVQNTIENLVENHLRQSI